VVPPPPFTSGAGGGPETVSSLGHLHRKHRTAKLVLGKTSYNTEMLLRGLEKKLMSMLSTRDEVDTATSPLVATVAQFVDDIKKGIMDQHNASLDMLNDTMAAFSNCDIEKSKNDVGLQTGIKTIGFKTSEHETCRQVEKDAAITKGECDDALATLTELKAVTCAALEQLKQGPDTRADVCHSVGPEDYETWLQRNRDYFSKAVILFDKAKQDCTAATEKVELKGPECTNFTEARGREKSACDALQHELETATCSYGTLLGSSCGSYTDCWDAAMQAYNKTTPELKEQAESRKALWRAAMRMECLIATFGVDGQDAAIDKCIATVHDTQLFDIDIHPAPAKATCASAVPMPCASDYLSTRYSSLPAEAPAATCTPCMLGNP